MADKCILCGGKPFSKDDNVCRRCIDDFIILDKTFNPEWLLRLNEKVSFDIVWNYITKEDESQ